VSELHEPAGSALAKAWALPDTVISALAKHHAAQPELECVPVRIVALADRFAHLALESGPGLSREALSGHPSLAALEIYPDVLEKIVKRASSVKETLGALS
jgi:HD-like signal output (HDOD) protein